MGFSKNPWYMDLGSRLWVSFLGWVSRTALKVHIATEQKQPLGTVKCPLVWDTVSAFDGEYGRYKVTVQGTNLAELSSGALGLATVFCAAQNTQEWGQKPVKKGLYAFHLTWRAQYTPLNEVMEEDTALRVRDGAMACNAALLVSHIRQDLFGEDSDTVH